MVWNEKHDRGYKDGGNVKTGQITSLTHHSLIGVSALYVTADKSRGALRVSIVPCAGVDASGAPLVASGRRRVRADRVEGFAQFARGDVNAHVQRAVDRFHAEQISQARRVGELVGTLYQAIGALREYDERQAAGDEQR